MKKKNLGLFFSMFLLLTFQEEGARAKAGGGFVKTRGNQLVLNGAPFYGNGFNSYWLMSVGSDPSQRNKVSAAFEQARNLCLTVARTWAFSDGGNSSLQRSPGVYNEKMFQGLDFAISEAGKYGIKVILSLVNNFNDYGGKKQYVQWARDRGQSLKSVDDFYTNPTVRKFYQNHVKTVLTRKNSIIGVVYKDDPVIMAWELMNEPRCPSDLSGKSLQGWIEEMAPYVKSIDPNHLLEVGLEGFYGRDRVKEYPSLQVGTDFIANNQVPAIDFATVHSYPDIWFPNSTNEAQLEFLKKWSNDHVKDTLKKLKKPVMFAEFGKSSKDLGYNVSQRNQMYDMIFSTVESSAKKGGPATGGLFWQLQAQGMDEFHDGYEVLVGEDPSTMALITKYSERLRLLR